MKEKLEEFGYTAAMAILGAIVLVCVLELIGVPVIATIL